MKRSSSLSRLITLARIAREKIENLASVEGGPSDLTGYCGVAARYIEIAANREGIYPLFVAGCFRAYNRLCDDWAYSSLFGDYKPISGHCWLEHDGHIVDITATQFRNAKTKVNRNFGRKIYTSVINNPHYEKQLVGQDARKCVAMWYIEPVDDIVEKADRV